MKDDGNKKKIVIVTRQMVMGGIEKALISMIESIPKDEFDITVLVMAIEGELVGDIPNYINLKCLYGDEQSAIQKMWNKTKKGKLISAFSIGWYTILGKKAKTVYEQEMYHSKMLPISETKYDLAIAYHTPASFPVVYVMNNLRAKTKAAWIHSDVSLYERELQPYKEFYQKYDNIFCVSKYAMNKFIEMHPNLKEKTSVFFNILNKNKLNLMSNDVGFNDQFEGIRLLTVGRLTSQKGQDIIPSIIIKLKSDGFNVRWYCIGDGESRPEIENLIKKNKLEEDFILLGTKNNPYPYIKQCDLYVQPSRHEGYCITLAEARAFYKPIITTDFVGAREQIIDGKTGTVVRFNEHEIYSSIVKLLSDYSLLNRYKKNLENIEIDNNTDIKQLLSLV